MIPAEIAKELHQVPESVIREYAEHLAKKVKVSDNTYQKLLESADIFRHANAHPIFLSNQDGSKWAVTSEETFLQQLH